MSIYVHMQTQSHTHTHSLSPPTLTALRGSYLYQPLIHPPALPWPDSLQSLGNEASRERGCQTLLLRVLDDLRYLTERTGGRRGEREERGRARKGAISESSLRDGTFPISSFSLYWLSWTQSLTGGREEKRGRKSFHIKWNHMSYFGT